MNFKRVIVLSSFLIAGVSIAEVGVVLPYTVIKKDGAVEIRNGGYGSSATIDPHNHKRFYAMTDRGPNAKYKGNRGKGKIFPIPAYTPRIGYFEITQEGKISKIRDILLKDTRGNTITGLPNPSGLGGTGEIPYDTSGNVLLGKNGSMHLDRFGLDPEGLAVLNDGTFWVSDEYGPHMVHFDKNGREIGRINPFVDDNRTTFHLPEEFANRRPNRGMEGLTITPDQKTLVGIMQSTMYNPNKKVKNNTLTRIVTVDLQNGATKQYLYKQEKNQNANSEITAIDNNTFLVIERDGSFLHGGSKKANPEAQKHVYRIRLSTGTNLESIKETKDLKQDKNLGLTIQGKTLEEIVIQGGWRALADRNIVPVKKELVVDMAKEAGYPHDKMEGLIVFDDNTLGILNDDDFAVWSKKGKLIQKYIDANRSVVDGNTLYVVHDLNLTGI